MEIDEQYPGIPRTLNRFFTYHMLGCLDEELSINGIGLKETMKPCFNMRLSGNKDFLILYFYDYIDFKIGEDEFLNVKNRWIILTPGQKHSYGNVNEPWCHSWIHISGAFIEKLLKDENIPLNQLLNIDISSFIENLIIRVHEEVYYNNPPIMKIIKNHLDTCLINIGRRIEHGQRIIIPKEYQLIKQLLDFRYYEKIPLSKLADIAGCTIPYFSFKFKSIYKMPPIDYLVNRRMEMAKYFLDNSDNRISEISLKVGYSDVYYFSKLFKKKIGCSPSSYKSLSC